MPGSILLADDEEKILKTLGRALRDDGYEVTTAANARDAARCLNERAFDLLVIDFLMPDRTGLDVIRDLVASAPDTERPAIVMMTAHGSIESAVEAMKLAPVTTCRSRSRWTNCWCSPAARWTTSARAPDCATC